MLSYVVVACHGQPVPAHVRDLLDDADTSALPFDSVDHLRWSDAAGSIVFGGWQSRDALRVGSHWHEQGRRLTAFSGHLWPRSTGWAASRPWAPQLASFLESHPLPGSSDDFHGVFTALSLQEQGGGHISTDPLGLGLLYTGSAQGRTAFGNRADLVARALAPPSTPPQKDVLGVGWLPYCGYLVGDRTGYADVRTVPPGASVTIEANGRTAVTPPKTKPWMFPDPGPAADREALLEVVRSDIAASVHHAAAIPAPRQTAHLTGGKDSRLILSILLAEGLDETVDFLTLGSPTSPDVVAARELAGRLGLRHAVEEPGPLDECEFLEHLRRHVARSSGMLGAWDLKDADQPLSTRITLSGLCGEALRTNAPFLDMARPRQGILRAFLMSLNADAGNLMRPEARSHYEAETERSLMGGAPEGSDAIDLADEFYLRNRLRRWFGADQEIDTSSRVLPLYSIDGIRAAFAIGPRDRHDEVIHFEVMRRCHAELARTAFEGRQWREGAFAHLGHLGDVADYRSPRPLAPAGPAPQPWQRTRLMDNLGVVRTLLVERPEHPVFEVLDPAGVRAALDAPEALSIHGCIQLYGAAAAAIWLDDA